MVQFVSHARLYQQYTAPPPSLAVFPENVDSVMTLGLHVENLTAPPLVAELSVNTGADASVQAIAPP
jgi:hypothetical protein